MENKVMVVTMTKNPTWLWRREYCGRRRQHRARGPAVLRPGSYYEVESTGVYGANTQTLTLNEKDDIMEGEAEDADSVAEYVLLGDDVTDGIFSWIAVGINPTTNYTITSAAYYSANGRYSNSNSPGAGGAPPSPSA